MRVDGHGNRFEGELLTSTRGWGGRTGWGIRACAGRWTSETQHVELSAHVPPCCDQESGKAPATGEGVVPLVDNKKPTQKPSKTRRRISHSNPPCGRTWEAHEVWHHQAHPGKHGQASVLQLSLCFSRLARDK